MKAMIFAAGRGERMRPLTDTTPKPLLKVQGKPLIEWHILNLARAGFKQIVINHAWLGEQIEAALGDGARWGVHILWSREPGALETAGGIAYALPLLGEAPFLAVSADIFSDYDYCQLVPKLRAMATGGAEQAAHLVMVPNPDFHPKGDFGLNAEGRLVLEGGERLTYGNICLLRPESFAQISPGTKLALRPIWEVQIQAGQVYGECFTGAWHNVGTPAQLAALQGSSA